MNISRGKDVGSSVLSRNGKRSVCLFPRDTILNIQHSLWCRARDDDDDDQHDDKSEKRWCASRVLFARFLLSRACMSSCALRTRLAHANVPRVQCASIASTYLYMLSGSVFSTATVYFCASYTENIRGSLFREREREKVGGLKEQGETDKRWKTAAGKQVSSTERDDRYTLPCHPTRVTRGNKRSYIL